MTRPIWPRRAKSTDWPWERPNLAFDQFYILTKGGPDNSTVTVVPLIVREAFQRQNLGTAAAISIVVLAALLVLNTVQFLRLRAIGDE